MLKYTRYLLRSSFRKLSTILIPLGLALIFGGTLGIQIANNKSDISTIDGLLAYYYLFPFIFGPLYVATKALTIFKDGEEDGTELIIVAKPIKRIKIIFAKFLTLYVHILFFSVFIFLLGIIVAATDGNASGLQKINFAGSLFVGNLVITIIMSSIITFIASSYGKIATLVTAIMIPFVFSITSFILAPLGNGQIVSVGRQENAVVIKNNGDTTYTSNRVYDKDGKTIKEAIEEQEKGWYKNAAYIDVYQQLIKFYSLFQSKNSSLIDVTSWKKHVDNEFAKDAMKLNINGKEYSLIYFRPEGQKSKAINNDVINSNIQDAKDLYSDKTLWDGMNTWDSYKTAVTKMAINIKSFEWKDSSERNNELAKIPAFNYLLARKYKENSAAFNVAFWKNPETLSQVGLFESSKGIDYYTETPWVNPIIVYVLWSTIAISLSGLVVFKYLKRDFK